MKIIDLVSRIEAADPKVKKATALRVVTLLITEIRKAAASGEEVVLQGLGTFRMADKPGEQAGRRLVFRPAKAVRDLAVEPAAESPAAPS